MQYYRKHIRIDLGFRQRVVLLALFVAALTAATIASIILLDQSSGGRVAGTTTIFCQRICEPGASCVPNTCANLPAVTTGAPSAVTQSSVFLSGNIDSDGGDTISRRGFAIATTGDPASIGARVVASGSGANFSIQVSGLIPATTYYAKAFADNQAGSGFGGLVSFVTLSQEQQVSPAPSQQRSGGAPTVMNDSKIATPQQFVEHLISVPGWINVQQVSVDFVGASRSTVKIEDSGSTIVVPYNGELVVFNGRTNIRNARIFFTLQSKLVTGTAIADSQGNWSWVVPEQLNYGNHTLTVLAVSPEAANLTSLSVVNFKVEPVEISKIIPRLTEPVDTIVVDSQRNCESGQYPESECFPQDVMMSLSLGSQDKNNINVRVQLEVLNPNLKDNEGIMIVRLYDTDGNMLNEKVKVVSISALLSEEIVTFELTESRKKEYIVIGKLELKDSEYASSLVLRQGQYSSSGTALFGGAPIPHTQQPFLLQSLAGALTTILILLLVLKREIKLHYSHTRQIREHVAKIRPSLKGNT